MLFGFLNVNKPIGMTSHDVIAVLRKICKIKQIGHTGTLDPMASGVLPVAIGKASRLIEFLQENKAYRTKIIFGKVSDTYDTEGAIKEYSQKKVTKEDIECALKIFEGKIEQIPPAYSAVHYKGKRLYELARNGVIPDDIPKRTVFVSKIELINFDYDSQSASVDIECSKGTYIRSIVHDLGLHLGVGAVMSGLERTKSGCFVISNSVSLDLLSDFSDIEKNLINPIDVLSFNCHELSEIEFQKIRHGQSLYDSNFENEEFVSLVFKGELVAIAQFDNLQESRLVTKKVFVS